MERTNIRSVESLPEAVDLAVVDVSFISWSWSFLPCKGCSAHPAIVSR
jgi:predicted rRNA methylase YqxC with S4 and FtsJ domains